MAFDSRPPCWTVAKVFVAGIIIGVLVWQHTVIRAHQHTLDVYEQRLQGKKRSKVHIVASEYLTTLETSTTTTTPKTTNTSTTSTSQNTQIPSSNAVEPSNFIYLLQGADVGMLSDSVMLQPNRTLVFLEYAPSPEATQQIRETLPKGCNLHVIQGKDTTWTTGRNQLMDYAVSLVQDGSPGFEYYIMMDGDISQMVRDSSAWFGFEEFLRQYQPAVGYITSSMRFQRRDQGDFTCAALYVDANVNAFHRNTVGVLLPYDSQLEAKSWYYSQYLSDLVVALLFSGSRIGWNKKIKFHRTEGQHASYPREFIPSVPHRHMESLFLAGTLRDELLGPLHPLSEFDGITISSLKFPRCKTPASHCCDDTKVPPPVTDKWMMEIVNRSHPYGEKLLKWRTQHHHLLAQIQHADGRTFFPPKPQKAP